MRGLGIYLFTSLFGVWATGCFTFRNVDDLFESDADTQSSSDTDDQGGEETTPTDADSGSGSDSRDSNTQTPSDTDPESDSASASDTDSESDSQITSDETDTGSESESITDTITDFETTCEDVCANTCCGEECCENEAAVCYEGACCAPATCEALNAQCGQVSDGCGGTLECGSCEGETTYCSDAGQCVDDCEDRICGPSPTKSLDCGACPGETQYCSVAGQCVDDCEGRICGLSPIESFDCGVCPSLYPYCTEEGRCIECMEFEDENCDGFVCDLEANACLTDCGNDDSLCATGLHCDDGGCIMDVVDGSACDEPSDCASQHCQNQICCRAGQTCCAGAEECPLPEEPICSPTTFSCRACDEEDLCAAQHAGQKPFCDAATGRCEECVQAGDCRNEELAVNPSPLGLCTPEHTCTCWVQSETWKCSSSDQCPEGTICARDTEDLLRFVCLHTCDAQADPIAGLACQPRGTGEESKLVWAPATTCFAFDKFGTDCSSDSSLCSFDGIGGINDGLCIDGTCSFPCPGGDAYCPEGKTCGDSFPYNGACVP